MREKEREERKVQFSLDNVDSSLVLYEEYFKRFYHYSPAQMMAAVLESLIFLVIESTQLEYETYLLPHIRSDIRHLRLLTTFTFLFIPFIGPCLADPRQSRPV